MGKAQPTSVLSLLTEQAVTASAHQMIQILLNSSTISYNIYLCVRASQHPLVPHVGF